MYPLDEKLIFTGVAPVILYQEELAKHTTWRIGGPADVLAIPDHISQVMELVRVAKNHGIPYFVLGRGSNLLVKDGGIRGLVIKMGELFSQLTINGSDLVVQSGRSIVSTAHVAMKNGLSGLEFATGIPGTVGGAVMMNAGAHGSAIQDVIQSVQVLTPAGEVANLLVPTLNFHYRSSALRDSGNVVLSATFALTPGNVEEMLGKVKAWSLRRHATQPLSFPSCGSVFRNPPGDHAARLIEAVGLKGTRIGDAMISDLHANFIINLGHASAKDVMALMKSAQERVKAVFAIELVPEVRLVGEDEARG
jgi:UDP-N-acetylmuramate dehydrogenase